MRDGVVLSLPDSSQSFTGRRWVWRRGSRLDVGLLERTAAAIAQVHGVPDIAARLLAARGLDAETARPFLAPRLRE